MSFTTSGEGQLRAGLLAFLVPALSGLVQPANILPPWTDMALVNPGGFAPNTPYIIIALEHAKAGAVPGGNSGGFSGRAAVPATADAQGNVTSLVEVAREQQAVRFIILCNGVQGPFLCDRVSNKLLGALGQARDIPLPDALEAIPATQPWTVNVTATVYGLTARLVYNAKYAVDNDAARHEYRYDVLYTAYYSDYATEVDPLITGIDLTSLLQS